MPTARTLPTPDGDMPVAEASPAGAAHGAVVVVQEAFGLNDHIESLCDRLAAAGFHALAPALFHRVGSPTFAYDDLPAVMPVMNALTAEGIGTDLDACYRDLADKGFDESRTGIVGFCMGGTVALWAGVQRPLGAAVTFYGGGVSQGRFGFQPLAEISPDLKTPWLGLFGDQDQGIPVDDVEALRTAASKAPVSTEIVRYPDAGHGFNCDARGSYHESSAADGWKRMLDFFTANLKV
ncbi:MAG: dienelactone hydrolase family protein [Acidobacteria bacterium]|nr:dienelactone hydrolase family protein [Acidobacteriota bacterium]